MWSASTRTAGYGPAQAGCSFGADVGEQGDLLSAQPGHPARRTVVGQPDRAEAEFGAPSLEEFSQLVAMLVAGHTPSLAVPLINKGGEFCPWLSPPLNGMASSRAATVTTRGVRPLADTTIQRKSGTRSVGRGHAGQAAGPAGIRQRNPLSQPSSRNRSCRLRACQPGGAPNREETVPLTTPASAAMLRGDDRHRRGECHVRLCRHRVVRRFAAGR